jgi:hypothetical protein
MRNVLWPLMNAGIEGFKVHIWRQLLSRQLILMLACAAMLCHVPNVHFLKALPSCLPANCASHPAQPSCSCPLLLQPDKVSAGDGILSPLDIPIPGAETGKEADYYYHDRWAQCSAVWQGWRYWIRDAWWMSASEYCTGPRCFGRSASNSSLLRRAARGAVPCCAVQDTPQ